MVVWIAIAVFIGTTVLALYGVWCLAYRSSKKRAMKYDEERLLKEYRNTVKSRRLIIAVVFTLLSGPFGIYFYYLLKQMHFNYEEELRERGSEFEIEE